MDVQFAFVCESATHKEGEGISAAGIGRNELDPHTKSLVVCGQLGFSLVDVGVHHIEVELNDPDGQLLWHETLPVEFPSPIEPDTAYGVAPFILQFLDLDFGTPGPHVIEFFSSGDLLYKIPPHLPRQAA